MTISASYSPPAEVTGPRPRRLALGVRSALLLLCLGLAVAAGRPAAGIVLIALAALAGIAVAVPEQGLTARVIRTLESAVTAGGVIVVGAESSPLFPYLLAPAFAGGLAIGLEGALSAPGAGAVILLIGAFSGHRITHAREFSTTSGQWVLLAIIAGLMATWIARLLHSDRERPYASAYRLLSELRAVARRLPGGLDAATMAEGLLQTLASRLRFERASVLVRSGGDRLVPLAHHGTDRLLWEADVSHGGPVGEAWADQEPQTLTRLLSDPASAGTSVIIPLQVGMRTFGLVGFETAQRLAFTGSDIALARRLVDESALRLETALLFDDLREVATVEERRRLAREIHDGIAQELASLGYRIDELTAEARGGRTQDALAESLLVLRSEVTRIVTELRLSIFDLRSDVDQHGGLGAALGEYVRSVGTGSGITVHLSLSESTVRLPAETEAELLRIAQEAVTNARRHAAARNLWVGLVVDPPSALLRIEDDGRGLGTGRADSFGIEVMRERAERLRGELDISDREGGGTLVEVRLGETRTRGSVVTPRQGVTDADDRAARR